TRAHDRLAQLHYQRGDLDRAAELLSAWQRLAPDDVHPAVKRAIVEQQRGNAAERDNAIRSALEHASGEKRAAIALLGAKLILASARAGSVSDGPNGTVADASGSDAPTKAEELLLVCLHEQPNNVEALSCLAMVRCVAGDARGLAELAPLMD